MKPVTPLMFLFASVIDENGTRKKLIVVTDAMETALLIITVTNLSFFVNQLYNSCTNISTRIIADRGIESRM